MPAVGDLELERRHQRRGHPQRPGRPGGDVAAQEAGRASVPRIGTGRVCGTAAGIAPRLIHSTTPNRRASSTMSAHERAPAIVGLRTDEDEEVALARSASGAGPAPARSAP